MVQPLLLSAPLLARDRVVRGQAAEEHLKHEPRDPQEQVLAQRALRRRQRQARQRVVRGRRRASDLDPSNLHKPARGPGLKAATATPRIDP